MSVMRQRWATCAMLIASALPMHAANRPEADKAFDDYVAIVERGTSPPPPATKYTEPHVEPCRMQSAPDAAIWDCQGEVFVPNADIAKAEKILTDYENYPRFFKEVKASHTLSHNGDDFEIAMKLGKHDVIDFVMDAVCHAHYGRTSHALSVTSRLADIKEEGLDLGILKRSNTYFTFQETDGGLDIEYRTISLSRSPGPFKKHGEKTGADTVRTTLQDTRDAIGALARSSSPNP